MVTTAFRFLAILSSLFPHCDAYVSKKMSRYTRNIFATERMSFHARVGQSALNRIGLLPQTRPPAVPSEGNSVSPGFSRLPKVILSPNNVHFEPQSEQKSQIARGFGFPIPGPQDPSPESVIGNDFFVREHEFQDILDDGDYDYIVIGSSFTALAFIQAAREINANVRILVLERGRMWLPSHFQNLPLPFRLVLGGKAETFPWTLSEQTYNNHGVPGLSVAFLRGYCPFFGGRSTIWSAWCPNPEPDRFRKFPESMMETMKQDDFWPKVNKMLNIIPANKIGSEIFGSLQDAVDEVLAANIVHIPTAKSSEPAKLAVGPNQRTSSIKFVKYSVPGPLLSIVEEVRNQFSTRESRSGTLQIVTDCVIKRLGALQSKQVRSIETSRGTLSFLSKTKIILCAGAIPNTTLVLNSFPNLRNVSGKRLTGHSMSHVTARVSKKALLKQDNDKLQLAANYLHGDDKVDDIELQYHIQITAIYCPKPLEQAEDLARECPDFAAAPTLEQLETSTDKVVFVCATLGELEEGGGSHVEWTGGSDPTTNVTIQYKYTERDKKIWTIYEKATLDALKVMSNGMDLEYWHEGRFGKPGKWDSVPPIQEEMRIPGVVHEASTLFMGTKAEGGSVDENYLLHGTDNVYVTGSALFPTSGSWNPTPAMCGFARDLAKKIVHKHSNNF